MRENADSSRFGGQSPGEPRTPATIPGGRENSAGAERAAAFALNPPPDSGHESPTRRMREEIAMKFPWAALLAATIGLTALAPIAPASADEFTPAQKQELGPIIRDYLVSHPEVLREAIEALDKHDKDIAQAERQKAVSDRAGPLFSSPFQANVGNPDGGATLVEFFDYNCHYCKGALPDIAKLMKDDPNLKVVLKDFPVLGPGSVEAAQVASAARNQLPGDRFWAFHSKLLGMHGPVGKAEALAVAKEMGLDMDRLTKDMGNPQIQSGLQQIMTMADALQINGTPSFVVGQEVVVGAVGYDQLKDKIDAVHKCGRSVC
jgi:protein-disulfide isomerase